MTLVSGKRKTDRPYELSVIGPINLYPFLQYVRYKHFVAEDREIGDIQCFLWPFPAWGQLIEETPRAVVNIQRPALKFIQTVYFLAITHSFGNITLHVSRRCRKGDIPNTVRYVSAFCFRNRFQCLRDIDRNAGFRRGGQFATSCKSKACKKEKRKIFHHGQLCVYKLKWPRVLLQDTRGQLLLFAGYLRTIRLNFSRTSISFASPPSRTIVFFLGTIQESLIQIHIHIQI